MKYVLTKVPSSTRKTEPISISIGWCEMVDIMANIYINYSEYRIAPDIEISPSEYHKKVKDGKRVWPTQYNVYSVPLGIRIASFTDEGKAVEFVAKRCHPQVESARVYPDICRCGRCGPAWDYVRVATTSLIFERCARCKMPMRHDVMLALNKPFTEDFDLDAFLEM
jgi:hypothetical protein